MKINRANLKIPRIRLIIQFEKSFIYSEFALFREYLYDNKFSIKDMQKEFVDKTTNIRFEYDTDSIEFDNYYLQESKKYFETYPKIFLNSFFVTMYSYFESKIYKLRTDLSKYDKSIVLKDVKRKKNESLINWHKRFLTVNYNLDLSSLTSNWLLIEKYGKIRNAITHNNSNIKREKTLNEYELEILNSLKHILFEIKTGNFFIENEKFIFDFLENAECCLKGIYNEIENKI